MLVTLTRCSELELFSLSPSPPSLISTACRPPVPTLFNRLFFVVFAGVNAVWLASDMAIDFRFSLLTGEDAEIATAMQGQPKGLQGKGKV